MHAGYVSAWLYIGPLAIDSGTLTIGDAVLFPGDQLDLNVECGEYVVEASVIDDGSDIRIARLRAALPTCVAAATARLIGAIIVDFAVVGMSDGSVFIDALDQACISDRSADQYQELYLDRLADDTHPWSIISLPGKLPTTMITVSPGWGDGRYEVRQLEVDGRGIGIEVEFIPPGARYIFG